MARILAVEDDASVGPYLRKVLAAEGHVIDLARDGRDGLQKLGQGSYDVVVVDLLMPVMSGFEFLEALEARTPQIPTIITSGIVLPGVHDYLKTRPRMRILSKPYTPEDLVQAIDDLLGEA